MLAPACFESDPDPIQFCDSDGLESRFFDTSRSWVELFGLALVGILFFLLPTCVCAFQAYHLWRNHASTPPRWGLSVSVAQAMMRLTPHTL